MESILVSRIETLKTAYNICPWWNFISKLRVKAWIEAHESVLESIQENGLNPKTS